MARIEVKEVQITEGVPNSHKIFRATLRDGRIDTIDHLPSQIPNRIEIETYLQFLKEVLAEMIDDLIIE